MVALAMVIWLLGYPIWFDYSTKLSKLATEEERKDRKENYGYLVFVFFLFYIIGIFLILACK